VESVELMGEYAFSPFLYLNQCVFLFLNNPEKLGGGVNNVPSEGGDGRERRVVSDNENQGGVDNDGEPVEDEQGGQVEGKNDCWWRYI
jgi:hypothetical protein